MTTSMKQAVAALFEAGTIQAFVAPARKQGRILPHVFRTASELDLLYTGEEDGAHPVRYPLNKILHRVAKQHPEATLGVLVRSCDERGLKELYKWNQLDPDRVVQVDLPCSQAMADACQCEKPCPDSLLETPLAQGVVDQTVANVEALPISERFTFWMKEFQRCIKCYGCRDTCPMCFCRECSLQEHDYIEGGRLPPSIPLFHLTRAVHMAGRCVDCGLCEEACPADIPLRTLYRKVEDITDNQYGFRPGINDNKSPLNILRDSPDQ